MSVTYLRSLQSVRERCSLLLSNPTHLNHFNVNLDALPPVINFILDLIKRDYPTLSSIPPHSRWRHFEASNTSTPIDRITPLLESWKDYGDQIEPVRRLLDLFVVSVLLDAGAGDKWKYGEYNRSEGLAIASLDWFLAGGFSSTENKFQVDATKLKSISASQLADAFKVSDSNPLVGVDGRTLLLNRLGAVCESFPEYFKSSDGSFRPGVIVDYLIKHSSTLKTGSGWVVKIDALWEIVMTAFSGVWPPSRTKLDGVALGDVWECKAMKSIEKDAGGIHANCKGLIPFHKLSQWLTYSLMEPMGLIGIVFEGVENMTGLAEYRNGGLFVDFGVLTLKNVPVGTIPKYNVYDDEVVEWRALTVSLLDLVAEKVREELGLTKDEMPLAKVLEAGTWKAGREIAKKLRPDTRGPPIEIISDGTVF
ncbi:hypothetical protein HK098_002762 [Nowakowskiella sp. JEL0407]|nr:hypothetical protein HK098_002762 [Nowakowskiella sp. JEL0407]